MEAVRSAFHAQLATVMDSLLAAAVCEIAKIFESSLCEHQVELAQKTNEISILRVKLEKVERRQRATGSDGDMATAEREYNLKPDAIGAADKVQTPRTDTQNFSGFKEESVGVEVATVKHEQAGSDSNLASITVQAAEGLLTDKGQTDPLSPTQPKPKLSHWDQRTAGLPHQEEASSLLLSISQSGRCSPKTDTSQTEEWLTGLSTTEESSIENLQANGPNCSSNRTAKDTGFGFEETSNEDEDSTFPFLDREPENHTSNHDVGAQDMEQREAQEGQSQVSSGNSQWRPRDRMARGTINNTRRVTTFSSRDPLRPHSNLQTLALRNINSLSHHPVTIGGNGRPYSCPYCTKCFTYPSHQRRHLLRHTGVRLHLCQFCEKRFLTPSELTVHTRTHTGERPFGCAQCGKRFARSGNLRAHQRDVHLGKRPFACSECGKRFAHRGNLRVHNHRVHQGDPFYLHQQESHMGSDTV